MFRPAAGHGSPMRPARDEGRKGRNVWSPREAKAEQPDAESPIPYGAVSLSHGIRSPFKFSKACLAFSMLGLKLNAFSNSRRQGRRLPVFQ